jgi:hypothetical protein
MRFDHIGNLHFELCSVFISVLSFHLLHVMLSTAFRCSIYVVMFYNMFFRFVLYHVNKGSYTYIMRDFEGVL